MPRRTKVRKSNSQDNSQVDSESSEERRYTCSHESCLQREPREFFPNWTSLQVHTRTAHPPTCPYSSCKGKTFSQQKGLRAHLRLHEQREIEEALVGTGDADDEGDGRRTAKSRRGGEMGRDWKCSEAGCDKDFKSVYLFPFFHSGWDHV